MRDALGSGSFGAAPPRIWPSTLLISSSWSRRSPSLATGLTASILDEGQRTQIELVPGQGSEAVKLDWESDGTSYSATGGSGRRYEIVVVYHATEWGVKGAQRGWCLKANDQVSHFHASLGQCKKAASLLEKRASLF